MINAFFNTDPSFTFYNKADLIRFALLILLVNRRTSDKQVLILKNTGFKYKEL